MLTILLPAKQSQAHSYPYGWLLPGLIIGGAIGYSLAAPRYYYPPAYYYPAPTYVYPNPTYVYPPPAYSSPPPAQASPPSAQASPPQPALSQPTGGQIFIYPRQGQNEQQLLTDRNECHNWAMDKTGYDPTKPPPSDMSTLEISKRSSDYHRALGACLDGRGYSMR